MMMNDRPTVLHLANWFRQVYRDAARTLTDDWRTNKYYFFAGVLVLITTLVVVAYYINHPQPEQYPDSVEYLNNAQRIQTHGQVVDPHRLPGFPLLITLVFALTG